MGFGEIVDPAAQVAAPVQDHTTVVPPRSPEELQARTVGWQGFLTRLQTDPAMQAAAVHAASQLAQGPGYGQSTWGHLAQSYEGATNAYGFEKQNEAAKVSADAKAALEAKHTQQQIASGQAADVRGVAADARGAAAEKRATELNPAELKLKNAQADKAAAEALGIPEKLRLEAQVQRASLAAHQAVAEAAKKNPTMQSAQTQFDIWGQSSEGAHQAGETDAAWKMRGWTEVRKGLKDVNAGTDVQADTAIIKAGENPLADEATKAAAAAALTRLTTKRAQGNPLPTAHPTITTQAEVEKLPAGTQYIYQGKVYTRGGK